MALIEINNAETALKRMKEMHSLYFDRESQTLRWTMDAKMLQDQVRSDFWSINQYFALYHLAVENDYEAARQRFYVAGRMGEYMNNVYGQVWLPAGSFHFYYAFLSDSPDLIQRYGLLENKNCVGYRFKSCILTDAMQRVINDDTAALEEDIAAMYAMKDKKSAPLQNAEMFADVFNAILHRDSASLKTAIFALENKRFKSKMQRHVGMYEHLISHHTLGLAKLAWYKGLPVEIDSPYVPRDMLPIAPLPHYHDPYHFLEGGQGIAG